MLRFDAAWPLAGVNSAVSQATRRLRRRPAGKARERIQENLPALYTFGCHCTMRNAERWLSAVALLEDLANEPNGIGLGFRIGASVKELGHPPRPDRIALKEISSQIFQGRYCACVGKQRTQ